MSHGRSGAAPSDPGNGHRAIIRDARGSGAVTHNGEIIATKLGWVREFNQTISVDPISVHTYRLSDLAIGAVEVRNNLWFMDINGSFHDYYQCH